MIYVTGGFSKKIKGYRGRALRDVTIFSLQDQRWTKFASMKDKRMGHSCCVLRGTIYVFGGDNNKKIDTIEKLAVRANAKNWEKIRPSYDDNSASPGCRLTPRKLAIMVPFEQSNSIVIFGGF